MGAPLDLLADNGPAIETRCRALGWMQPDEAILRLDAAGEGNMNRTLRVTTSTRTFILKQSTPFVAKYPQIAAPAERIALEDRFYTTVSKDGALAMRMPRRLGYDAQNRLLALEDVGSGSDLLDLYAGRGVADGDRGVFTALIYWLWRLHALQVAAAPAFENTGMRALNHAHIFVIPLTADNGAALDGGLEDAAAQLRADTTLRAIATNLGDIYLGRAAHASKACLLHGDYYPGSWLRHERLGVMIIDPEFAFFGAPEFDVGVLVAHLTFAGFSQTDIMGLLRSYVTPPGFDYRLAIRFAAMEIIRRLLGVAQLPLAANAEQKFAWLNSARMMIGT